jgi:hypothetical protein
VTEDGALGEEELLSFDAYLRETLLRISGAIQVLEELLSEKQSAEKSAAGHDGPQPAGNQANEADVNRSNVQNRSLVIRTNNTEKVRVMPGGNLGIGTTAPNAKLDVSGSGGATQCCAPVLPTLSLAEASSTQNRQAWLQFHNAGEAEAFIRLAGGRPAGSGREGQRRLEICQPLYLTWSAATGMLANVI